MEIIEYKNLANESMILILDKENDKAESMSKAQYEEMQAKQNEGIK